LQLHLARSTSYPRIEGTGGTRMAPLSWTDSLSNSTAGRPAMLTSFTDEGSTRNGNPGPVGAPSFGSLI
jgi:hypothetical protein